MACVHSAEYDLFQIELSMTEWRDDLKKVMLKARVENNESSSSSVTRRYTVWTSTQSYSQWLGDCRSAWPPCQWSACLAHSLRRYQFILLGEQKHTCVNNLSRVVRETERPGLKSPTNWLQVRCPHHYATTTHCIDLMCAVFLYNNCISLADCFQHTVVHYRDSKHAAPWQPARVLSCDQSQQRNWPPTVTIITLVTGLILLDFSIYYKPLRQRHKT